MSEGNTPAAFVPGQILCERFRVIRFIARGGMGEVYEAEDLSLGVHVALKTVPKELAEDRKALSRFKREITLSRQVTHPNICRVHDLFSHADAHSGESRLFLTMELLEGESLSDRIQRCGPLSPDEALPLVRQLVAGLERAHEAGVIHRDLKSDNIFLVSEEDGETRVVIMDFGLAKSFGKSGEETQTLTRGWVGTPAYVAPEQIRGMMPDATSDIYSLGIVLYEMVTGKRPFEGPDPISTAVQRLVEDPSSPSDIVPGLDPCWEDCILRCLKRDPKERLQRVRDVLEVLDGGLKAPKTRRRLWVYGAIPILVVVSVLLWLKWPFYEKTNRPSIAILGFHSLDAGESPEWLGQALSEMLGTELAAPGAFRLIPGEAVARAKIELGLEETRALSQTQVKALNQVLGADYLLEGSYLQLAKGQDAPLRLDLKFRSTTDSEAVIALGAEGSGSDLFGLIRVAGRKVCDTFGISGGRSSGDMLASFPGNKRALALYSQGLEKLWVFKPLEARRLLEEAIELEPDFPLAHAALARTWMHLGYGAKALDESQKAFESSGKLPRETRLGIEALYRQNSGQWTDAIRIYKALWTFYPDNPRYAMDLAEAQLSSGAAKQAAETVQSMRKADFSSTEAQIDLLDANIHQATSDITGQQELAARAAEEARKSGARLLYGRARLKEANALWILGEQDKAREALEAAATIFNELGDRRGVVEARISSGVFARDTGDVEAAVGDFKGAAEMAVAIEDLQEEFSARRLLGETMLSVAKLDEAEHQFQRAAKISEKTGDRQAAAVTVGRLALVQRKRGELDEARTSYQKAYQELLALGDRAGAATAANSLAIVLRLQGRPDEAMDLLKESLRLKREAGERRSMTVGLVNLANLAFDLGKLDEAESRFRQALDLSREFKNTRHEAYALFGLAEISRERNQLEVARKQHLEALRLRRDAGTTSTIGASLMALSLVDIDRGDLHSAKEEADEALRLLGTKSSSSLLPWAQLSRARVCIAGGELSKAQDLINNVMEHLGDGSDETLWTFLLMTRAMVSTARGAPQRARALLEECLNKAENSRQQVLVTETLIRLGLVERKLGLPKAGEHLRRGAETAGQCGYLRVLAMLPSGSGLTQK